MPATTLTTQVIPANGSLDDLVFAAADNVNGNDYVNTGKEIVVVRNDDAGAQTAVINSKKCSHGREQDITMRPAAAKYALAGPLSPSLFRESDTGRTLITPSAATLFIAIAKFTPATG